ncbi:MAG TPA: hypothetical protein VFI96_01315 [Longimicrobiaceae bacterium]|nr:hypothetical protein [Longimicrobiaceae bacterium]
MYSTLRRCLALAVPLLLVACGSPDSPAPTAPLAVRSASFALSQNGMALDRLARFDHRPNVTIAWAKKWIGPEGGRLQFLGFAVDVPAGAVSRVTQFSIRLPVDPQGSEHVVAEFGPHGATFAVPVTIELPYAGTSVFGEPSSVLWWNSDVDDWVDMGATVTADGERLSTTTTHFSIYGTASFSGTLTASGG